LLGKTAMERLQYDDAQDYFLQVVNLAQDEKGAEAQYYLAYIEFRKNDYRKSLETLFDLNGKYANYESWIGKSFLLIADNYIALEEYFQAKATLESLIEHSPDKEIVNEAKMRIKKLDEMTIEKEKEESVPDTLEIEDPANKNGP
jgi:TolA-binding protein